MIRYALKCAEDHRFESWFQSADAFEVLRGKGMVNCAICGSTDVQKAMMAPPVPRKGGAVVPVEPADIQVESNSETSAPVPDRPLSTPSHPAEEMLKAMRDHVEKNSTDVGGSFAKEARAMHLGDKAGRGKVPD